jgi:hypothetical protein
MRMATETLHEVQDASDRPRAVMVRMVAIDSSRQIYRSIGQYIDYSAGPATRAQGSKNTLNRLARAANPAVPLGQS